MEDLNVVIKQAFGEKFKMARNMTGYSRAKLAVELGVSSKTIQSWETGRTFPENMSLVPVIEKKLGFFIPDILGETVREEVSKRSGDNPSEEKSIIRQPIVDDKKETENVNDDTKEIDEVV